MWVQLSTCLQGQGVVGRVLSYTLAHLPDHGHSWWAVSCQMTPPEQMGSWLMQRLQLHGIWPSSLWPAMLRHVRKGFSQNTSQSRKSAAWNGLACSGASASAADGPAPPLLLPLAAPLRLSKSGNLSANEEAAEGAEPAACWAASPPPAASLPTSVSRSSKLSAADWPDPAAC